MKATILLPLIILFANCGKSSEGPVVIDTHVDILIVDNDSKNLLENDRFDTDQLKIYYMINGQKQLIFNSKMDYPKGYGIFKNGDNQSVLRVFLNDNVDTPITIIEYGENNTDTIKGEFSRKGSSIICTKVWYNAELKWDATGSFPKNRTFTITKNL